MAKSDNSADLSGISSSLSSPSSTSSASSSSSLAGGAVDANATGNQASDDDIEVPAHDAIADANAKGVPATPHPDDVARAAYALSRDAFDPPISKAQGWHHAEKQRKARQEHDKLTALGKGTITTAGPVGNELAEKIYVSQVDLKGDHKELHNAAQKSVAAAAAFNGASSTQTPAK